MSVRVYNINRPHPNEAVYIGRGSKWGNPFVIGRDGNRNQVIKKYKEWFIRQKDLMLDIDELEGRDLLCFCSPKKCHGDFLLMLANPDNTSINTINDTEENK